MLVKPLLGLRLALRCRTLCAAFASTAPASFASKQCQSNIHNHSRVFHSPVRAQDSSNRSDKNHQPNVNMRIVGRATQEPKLRLSLETRVAEDVTVICCKGRIAYGAEAAALSGEFSELAPRTRSKGEKKISLGGKQMRGVVVRHFVLSGHCMPPKLCAK